MKIFVLTLIVFAIGCVSGSPLKSASDEVKDLTPILQETKKLKLLFQRYKRARDVPVLDRLTNDVNTIYDDSSYNDDRGGNAADLNPNYNYDYASEESNSGSPQRPSSGSASDDSVAYYDNPM